MKLSRFAIHRPVFTIMSALIVLILGGISLARLSIDLMPDITYPTMSITTNYENAGPEEVEELVTRPIEQAMSAVPGVESVTTTSAEGLSQARVSFVWGTDLDVAVNDIRERLDRVTPFLPEGAENPRLRKFDLANFPILILGAAGKLDPIHMRQVIDDQIKYRIERLPGIAALSVHGGLNREIAVNLHADRIKALGLPLDMILSRIKSENVNIPAGTLKKGNLEVMIRIPGVYTDLKELRNTVIAIREGVPIQLKEVASVEDSSQKVTQIVRINGRPGVRLAVHKQSGMNTVEVAKRVLKEVARINQDIPQIQIIPIINTADYIQRSIKNLSYSILYGGSLAMLVLLFFLRNIRSTAIIATAIPLSAVATFALLYFSGFTINIMTLGGLALGIGMLVDNAIVVLENIYRLRESGIEPEQASVTGSEEVTAAIVASTLTTLAVFLPLIFLRGMSGIMFKQLAYVVSFSLGCSLAVALTLVPMLTTLLLKNVKIGTSSNTTHTRRSYHITGQFLNRMDEAYGTFLNFALSHKKSVVIGSMLILMGSLTLIPKVGVEFMPGTDEGEVRINAEMKVGTRVEVVDEMFNTIEAIVAREVPEVNNTVSYIGGTSWRATGSHTGQMRIALKPEAERLRSSEEIAAALRQQLSKIPGTSIRTREGRGLFLLRLGTRGLDKVQVEIRGHDLDTAEALARRVKTLVESVAGITDALVSRESGRPEELIIVDRQKAAAMKLSVSQIANMLQTVLSGTHASDYREAGDEFRIMVKLMKAEEMDTREILDLTLTNTDGDPIVLRNVVTVRKQKGPVIIHRKDQERIVTVSANISGRNMGAILSDIRKILRTIPVPRNFSITLGGDYEEQQKAFRELIISFVLALVLVYMVMASLYESLRDPFIVMFSVPFAAIGVILMLLATRTTFNVQSFIGCIMLGGIVVNNAILLVDHINLLRRRDRMPLKDAIVEAGRRRLRPILMTAMTTILALTPLAIGMGEGGEAQAPLARAVIGGLLSANFITLFLVPTVYSIFGHRSEK